MTRRGCSKAKNTCMSRRRQSGWRSARPDGRDRQVSDGGVHSAPREPPSGPERVVASTRMFHRHVRLCHGQARVLGVPRCSERAVGHDLQRHCRQQRRAGGRVVPHREPNHGLHGLVVRGRIRSVLAGALHRHRIGSIPRRRGSRAAHDRVRLLCLSIGNVGHASSLDGRRWVRSI